MKSSRIRTLASLAAASLAVTGVSSAADATVTYSNKGTAQLYDIVEAQYVLSDTRIVVLSNDTSNAVIQLVDPATQTVTNTLAFTAPNADGSNPWDSATDLEVTPNGQTAYVSFAGSNRALAKITLSTLTVEDFVSITGDNAISGGGEPEFVALRANGSTVDVFSREYSKTFTTSSLDSTGDGLGVAPEVGVTNKAFVSDPETSITIWPDITDVQLSGLGRISFLYSDEIFYAGLFSVQSIASALTANYTNGEIYVGTSLADTAYLARVEGYRESPNLTGGSTMSLAPEFDGVRQVVASADGSQLVALSNNGRIARVPLGRGWSSTIVEYFTITDASVTLGSYAVVAIKSDGSQVTYLDSRAGADDNIVNVLLANNASTAPMAPTEISWFASSGKKAQIEWVPGDDGGSELTKYLVQCTNGKSPKFRTVKSLRPTSTSLRIVRNVKKSIDCRVIARNSLGDSEPSDVVTITKKGGPSPI
jgi:hypothetical protein